MGVDEDLTVDIGVDLLCVDVDVSVMYHVEVSV